MNLRNNHWIPLLFLLIVLVLALFLYTSYFLRNNTTVEQDYYDNIPPWTEPPGWPPYVPECGDNGYFELLNSTKGVEIDEEGGDVLWIIEIGRNDNLTLYFRVVVNESTALCWLGTTNYTITGKLNSISINGTHPAPLNNTMEYSVNGIQMELNNVTREVFVLKITTHNALKGEYRVEVLVDVRTKNGGMAISTIIVLNVK